MTVVDRVGDKTKKDGGSLLGGGTGGTTGVGNVSAFGKEHAPDLAAQKGTMGTLATLLQQVYLGHFDGTVQQRENQLGASITAGGLTHDQLLALNQVIAHAGYGYVKPPKNAPANWAPPARALQRNYNSFLSEYTKQQATNPGLTLYGWMNNLNAKGQIVDVANTYGGASTGATKKYLIAPTQQSNGTPGLAAVGNPSVVTQASSYDGLVNQLENWGFTNKQIQSLGPRAWQTVNSGVDTRKGLDVWLRQQPEYAQQFPGNIQRMKSGLPPLNESLYTSYVQQMQEMARASGLPQGFLSTAEIGQLIANEVKPTEMSQRLTNAYTAVQQADPNVLKALQDNYGLQPGHLAAWALDPHKATPLLQEQVQQAKFMAESQKAGLDRLTKQQAQGLSQFANQQGQSENSVAQGIDQAGSMKGLTGTAPGQERQGLTQDQLLQGAVGTSTAAKQNLAAAVQAQSSPLQGGGGDVMNQKGIVGAGMADQ